jgi:hypothetical protein
VRRQWPLRESGIDNLAPFGFSQTLQMVQSPVGLVDLLRRMGQNPGFKVGSIRGFIFACLVVVGLKIVSLHSAGVDDSK